MPSIIPLRAVLVSRSRPMLPAMRTGRPVLAAVAALTLAIVPAACGGDDDDNGASPETDSTATSVTSTPPAAAGDPDASGAVELALTATLSGAEEVPGPGVADGTGMAEVRVGEVELCYQLTTNMGGKPTGAHIHEAAKGAAGDVIVDLAPVFTTDGSASTAEACVKPDRAALVKISYTPERFYVNVHTAEHPGGAVRGQLARAPS